MPRAIASKVLRRNSLLMLHQRRRFLLCFVSITEGQSKMPEHFIALCIAYDDLPEEQRTNPLWISIFLIAPASHDKVLMLSSDDRENTSIAGVDKYAPSWTKHASLAPMVEARRSDNVREVIAWLESIECVV